MTTLSATTASTLVCVGLAAAGAKGLPPMGPMGAATTPAAARRFKKDLRLIDMRTSTNT